MVTSTEVMLATLAAVVVTASFPFYLYGAWIVLSVETVTWSVLMRHLRFIVTGLVLTTLPVVTWMAPRLLEQLSGFAALHAFLGLQAYAMLVFALTGIVRIFQVKRQHDLYNDPTQDVDLADLHENMGAWRGRLRIGVAGYVVFWLLAWIVGIARYFLRYNPV
ncbi:MAG: hypothetical protein SVG88_04365 [Halobacteriales archaeon]|nr:hypothetical protein [Halobacteriales archaeon]